MIPVFFKSKEEHFPIFKIDLEEIDYATSRTEPVDS